MKTSTTPEAYCAEMNCGWQGEVPSIAQCPRCASRQLRRCVHASRKELAAALKALVGKLDCLTTEEFARGGDRIEREAARALVARLGAP
jgi:hypothetical protein